jgi:hypothetical protein
MIPDPFKLDPLHAGIAFGPLAMYLVVLGAVNLSARPLVTTGFRDDVALGLAIAGLMVAGPMELFLIESAVEQYGAWVVWVVMFLGYALVVLFVALMMRPRLVIYNVTSEKILPVLEEVLARIDPQVRWIGNSVVSEKLGVQLTVELQPVMKNVQLVSSGPHQSLSGWRELARDLSAALRNVRGVPNPFGATLVTVGVLLAGLITWLMAGDPAGVQQALNNMLRRQ